MNYFILMTHSGWRYVVVILLILTLIKMLAGWLGKQKWSSLDSRLLLALRGAVYVQVILGLLLYILEQYWTEMRFTGEHVILMLLAVGGVEFAAARAKKAPDDTGKFKFASIGLAITFVLVYVGLMTIGGLFGSRY